MTVVVGRTAKMASNFVADVYEAVLHRSYSI